MAATLKIADLPVMIDSTGDLAKLLRGSEVVFELDPSISTALAASMLGELPQDFVEVFFTITPGAAWTLPANLNMTLAAAPKGVVTLRKSGVLFEYADSANTAIRREVPVNQVFISISLPVNVKVRDLGPYSAGRTGVKAGLPPGDVFTTTHHQAFAASTKLSTALYQAFSRLVLPFQASKVLMLNDNDLLEFEFLGKLALGFGVTHETRGMRIGGRSTGEITRSFGNELAFSALTARHSFRAGDSFAVNYTQEDSFRFVLAREKSAQEDRVTLTILRMKGITHTKEVLGIELDATRHPDYSAMARAALEGAVDEIFAAVEQDDKKAACSNLKKLLVGKAPGLVSEMAKKIGTCVNGLLNSAGAGQVRLELLQEAAILDMALFQVVFDSNVAGDLTGSIHAAMCGDIAAALRNGAALLDSGSFVEQQFRERTAFPLEFELFDLWITENVLEYVDAVDVAYAGNGTLRLFARDVKHSQDNVGVVCDVRFLADPTKITADNDLDVETKLYVELLDSTPDTAAATREMLGALKSRDLSAAADRMLQFVAPGSQSARTKAIFPVTAFQNLRADPFHRERPGPMPHERDAQNYAAFVAAVREIDGEFLGFSTYEDWSTFNRNAIDGPDSTITPNREIPGNLNKWPDEFSNVVEARRDRFRSQSEGARHFMNLVASLDLLGREADIRTTEAEFDRLLESLNGIADNSSSLLKAALLALLRLGKGSPAEVKVEVDGHILSIAFTMAARQEATA
jgi:hypothetical protein